MNPNSLQKTNKEIQVKPCPFCGNKELIEDYSEYDNIITYWIECEKCEVIIEGNTKREAYDKWNRRAV